MREWDFFVIAALYEKVVEWGGTVDTLVSFLANEPIQTNPELGSLAGLFELNLQEYASHERLKEVLESGLSLSEHRKRCMAVLQQAYPTQYDFLSFPLSTSKALWVCRTKYPHQMLTSRLQRSAIPRWNA